MPPVDVQSTNATNLWPRWFRDKDAGVIHPDVVVLGGGIQGAGAARELARRGAKVLVLEAGEAGPATPASAGMLGPLSLEVQDDPILELYVRGRDLYREAAPILKEESGVDIGLWTDGILCVAFTDAEASQLRGGIAWLRQQGIHLDWLEPGDLHSRCPGIAQDALGATFAPEDSAIDPTETLKALRASAQHHGATFMQGERALEILMQNGSATGVRTPAGTRTAGAVVIAAGCWSGRILGLPRPLSVEPMRGQMAAMDWPAGEPGAIVFSHAGYVLQRGGEALVGATMEYAGFSPTVTDAGIAGILAGGQRVYPALKGKAVRRTWAGLRPATPDDRPFIGKDPEVPNLYYATGHGRRGILLSLVTAEIIAQLYAGETIGHDLSAVDPGRFWRPDAVKETTGMGSDMLRTLSKISFPGSRSFPPSI
jgi:glycine oxidase